MKVDWEFLVVWVVVKGFLFNKVILVLVVLLISVFVLVLIMVLLIIGGFYLCFEGVEKLFYKYLFYEDEIYSREERFVVISYSEIDMVVFEKDKIKGVICIDFILLVEIIVIVLGSVSIVSFII